jgi:uncharacterized membrane protein
VDEAVPNALYEPTQDERTYAALAHALQTVGWWIAPLVILIAKSNSKFVKFHALQALILQLSQLVFMFGMMAVMMATIFATIPMQPAQPQASQAPCGEARPAPAQPCDDQTAPAQPGKEPSGRPQQEPFPTALFILLPVFWLGWMGWFVLVIILTVLYALKAGRGEWKGYPLIGRLAARFVHIQLPH